MIPANLSAGQPDWRRELADAVSDPAELLRLLDLDLALLPAARAAARSFPLRVPRGFVARMRRGDPRDPLLRQVLPIGEELADAPGFVDDPVGDLAVARAPGVLAKYHGRMLVVATGACAVHCRYCFRRHFPYAAENPRGDGWRAALDALAADPTVTEAILSGGDPLSLSDARLRELSLGLSALPNLRRLRIHTRLPVVLPSRIGAELLAWLAPLPMQKVVVLHANHAAEVGPELAAACAALRGAGATLLNQSVLLRGVNDSPEALVDLSEALFAAGVLPYYLHQLDRVRGAAHFEVPDAHATALLAAAAARLPGYLVPRLVREVPGAAGKLPIELATGGY
jgi:EF-P beta-lysylation protein EpmB